MIECLLLAAAVLIGMRHRPAALRLARITGPAASSTGAAGNTASALTTDSGSAKGGFGSGLPSSAEFSTASPSMTGALGSAVGRARVVVKRIAGSRRSRVVDEGAQAATWDLLAACLSSGMAVPAAIRAVAADLPERAGQALRDTADLLALGGDPVDAWSVALDCPATAGLARGARRTARSGAALAAVARALAAEARERTGEAAEARAQRAAVLVSGPLALCFLPAFLCLGVVPIVLGLAGVLSNHI